MNDRTTADNNASSRYFTSIAYSADGTCLLAGGNSKYVCIYEISQQILLKKFQISFNRSLDGVLDEVSFKYSLSFAACFASRSDTTHHFTYIKPISSTPRILEMLGLLMTNMTLQTKATTSLLTCRVPNALTMVQEKVEWKS